MNRQAAGGVAAVGAANILLGVSSLYWHLLSAVSATTVLGYRVLSSLGVLGVLVVLLRRSDEIRRVVTDRRLLGIHVAAALLVAVNWLTFIWGSINGRVLETGLGYLIAPAVMIVLARLLSRDRLGPVRGLALALCVLGVVLLVVGSRELLWWVYASIGLSWGLYSYLKSRSDADPITGLTVETTVLAAVAGLAVLLSPFSLSAGSIDAPVQILLIGCGIVSVVPLYLIALGVRRTSATAAGFLQYVLPTTQLVVAIVFYGQLPSGNTVLCFAVVWAALLLIILDTIRRRRRSVAAEPRREDRHAEL